MLSQRLGHGLLLVALSYDPAFASGLLVVSAPEITQNRRKRPYSMRLELIRLVVWDLDHTFWHGSILEEGIHAYIAANQSAVVELSGRGVISSICSRGDRTAAEEALRRVDMWQYFVFPSISWAAKGPRLRLLIKKFRLRPASVLFIDDNATNRAEAQEFGIQVAGTEILPGLLSDPRLAHGSDRTLLRLKRYKLLEELDKEYEASGLTNDEFLRRSEIRVIFEHDIEQHIDRAIDLINRTNQLNFTKCRLPTDQKQACDELLQASRGFSTYAALVKVIDRFGDHGYCGFVLLRNGRKLTEGRLLHFAFSCRIVGMGVEHWVYDQLGRPRLDVVHPIVSDLSLRRDVDWIRLAGQDADIRPQAKPIAEIRLRGGCEIDALAPYLAKYTEKLHQEGSQSRRPFFVRKDCLHHITIPNEAPLDLGFVKLAEKCGFRAEDFNSHLFDPSGPKSIVVYSLGGSAEHAYRHRASGRMLTVELPGMTDDDITTKSTNDVDALLARLDRVFTPVEHVQIHAAVAALKRDAELIGPPTETMMKEQFNRVMQAIPRDCKVAVIAMDEYLKVGCVARFSQRAAMVNGWLADICSDHNIRVFTIGDYLTSESDREFTGHFCRLVYFRLAADIISWALEKCRT
jgi:FkbH-like protein